MFHVWSWTYGLACWLATHGPRRSNGDRLFLPVARRVMRLSNRFWRDSYSPDW